MSSGRLPNFIYVGLPKAASTWVFKLLTKHPQVFATPAKETYFFDRYYGRGVNWYASHFRGAANQRIVAEVCHDYLYLPLAAERIYQTLGPIRLMVCLREPADWLFSRYLFACRNGLSTGTFEQFLEASPQVIEECDYARLLRPFLDRFGREQIYVTLFEQLGRNPAGFARGLWDFLQVDPLPLPDGLQEKVNAAARPRSPMLAYFAKQTANVVRGMGGAELLVRVKEQGLVQRILYQPLPAETKPQLNPATLARIRGQLAGHVHELDELVGIDCSAAWNYTADEQPSPGSTALPSPVSLSCP